MQEMKAGPILSTKPNKGLLILRLFGVTAVALVVARLSWVSDDALITMRQALNFTHGWGPGFNATESVQGYTHPLWFLLWSGVGSVTNEWIVSITVISLLCVVVAVAVVMWNAKSALLVLLAAGALLASNAFTEYSTSGLENPLAYLLAGVCIVVLTSGAKRNLWSSVVVGLCVAALGLTRLDLLLVVLPVCVYWAWMRRHDLKILLGAATGFCVPMLVWHLWSRATYSSFLPNTFEAKRNVDIPTLELMGRGLRYLWVGTVHDPATSIVLYLGLLVVLFMGRAIYRFCALGVVGYLGYVVLIGGDFMAGRFLAVPLYVVVLLVVLVFSSTTSSESNENAAKVEETSLGLGLVQVAAFLGVVFFLFAGLQMFPFMYRAEMNWQWWTSDGIADERGAYVEINRGMYDFMLKGDDWAKSGYRDVLNDDVVVVEGEKIYRYPTLSHIDNAARNYPHNTGGERLRIPAEVRVTDELCGGLGHGSVLSGPLVHWVDTCALTDRFIAGLPYLPISGNGNNKDFRFGDLSWRMGHFNREIPEGYLDAVAHNDPSLLRDSALAEVLRDLWGHIR